MQVSKDFMQVSKLRSELSNLQSEMDHSDSLDAQLSAADTALAHERNARFAGTVATFRIMQPSAGYLAVCIVHGAALCLLPARGLFPTISQSLLGRGGSSCIIESCTGLWLL